MFSITMTETFSRSFLQGMPEERKQEIIAGFIRQFIDGLKGAALAGKTSYMFSLDNNNYNRFLSQQVQVARVSGLPMPEISNADLISAFQKKFPDCSVSYQEVWVDINPTSRVLKQGITIDWS